MNESLLGLPAPQRVRRVCFRGTLSVALASLRFSGLGMVHGKTLSSRKVVLMSGAIEFADSSVGCLISNMSISGAALEISKSEVIPERFNLFFKADGTRIPCRVAWRETERIGVAFE
jgi:hypothetical protein